MAFPRQKPTGYTDDVDVIKGSEATGIDTNQSNAIDGAAGGSYTPTGPINITDAGGGGLGDVDVTGTVTMKSGAMLEFTAGATISNTDNQTIDPADGLIREFAAPTAGQRDHDIVAAGNKGRMVWITRPSSGGNAIVIHRSGFAGAAIATLPASAWSSVLLYDDGTNWRLLDHADATPGAHA